MLKIRFTRSRHEEIKFFMKYLKEFDPQIINSYEIIIKGRKLRLLASKLYRFYIKDIFLENLSVYFDLLIKDKEYFSKLNEKYTEKYDFNKDPKFLDNVLTTKIRGKIKYIENKPLGRKPSTYEPHSYVYDIEVKKNHNFIVSLESSLSTYSGYKGIIVSNCHHVSAEFFSKSLPKTATRYNLGLSATPDRKDGLTKVFKWYLGPIGWQSKRENPLRVIVKSRWIHSANPLYDSNLWVKSGRSMPNVAGMLNAVADYPLRNNYIANLAIKCYKEGRCILILSSRIILLKEIYKLINSKGVSSVGLFLGSMKQHERDLTLTRKIILATYQIAAEGFDCKKLNTLIFATSQSDVIQASGRILRDKDSDVVRIIYDLVDCFGVFESQWRKRQTYYRKCKYESEKEHCFFEYVLHDFFKYKIKKCIEQRRIKTMSKRAISNLSKRIIKKMQRIKWDDDIWQDLKKNYAKFNQFPNIEEEINCKTYANYIKLINKKNEQRIRKKQIGITNKMIDNIIKFMYKKVDLDAIKLYYKKQLEEKKLKEKKMKDLKKNPRRKPKKKNTGHQHLNECML